uniref:Chaperone DnaJ C-terminal domain-containing protein n=1 Tax=Eucampia antarctica TaxID=49252 RepID=A0A7S2R0Q7_9STRA
MNSGGMGGQGGPEAFHFSEGQSFNGMGGSSFGDGLESMFSGGRNTQGSSSTGNININLSDILKGFMGGQSNAGMSSGGGYGTRPEPGMGFFSGQQQGRNSSTNKSSFSLSFHCTLEELANGCTKKLKVKNPAIDPLTGQRVLTERIYNVKVKPGWKKGTKVKFGPTSDGFPSLSFILDEKKHRFFRRINNDIVWKCNISQNQAEKGVKIKVPLLDGNLLEILVQDGISIQQGQRKIIKGKGMPIKGGPKRGDLIIEFNINVGSL